MNTTFAMVSAVTSADFFAFGAAGFVSAASLTALANFVPAARIWGPVVSRGPTQGPPCVALTFDDGPTPGGTDRILDALKELAAPAAFFAVGQNVVRHPDLLRRVDEEGHLVGNHTFDHRHWGVFGTAGFWRRQVERTDEAIHAVIGKRPALFRPPMGHKTPFTVAAAHRSGQAVVTWNRRALDGLRGAAPSRILSRLLPNCVGGDIVLLHDGVEPNSARDPSVTVEIIRPLILGLRERGLEIVRLDALLGVAAYR